LTTLETDIGRSSKTTQAVLDGVGQPIITAFRRIGSGKLCSIESVVALEDSLPRSILLV
jgi:hypothetical protein